MDNYTQNSTDDKKEHSTQIRNYEAERSVLLGSLQDENTAYEAFNIVQSHKCFTAEVRHRDLAKAIISLLTSGKPVDYTHVVTELNETDKSDVVDFVNQLVAEADFISLGSVLSCAQMVRESYIKYCVQHAVSGKEFQSVMAANGNIDVALQAFIGRLDEARTFVQEQTGQGVSLPNAADLMGQVLAETAWAIPEMLPGGFTILGGKPKIGKSWMALQISHAICSGGKLFERDIRQGRVLYLALEDGPKRLQKRLKIQGWDDESAKHLDYLFLREFMQKIGPLHEGGSQKLAAMIERESYTMVVIDTIARSLPGLKSQNEYQVISDAFGPIQEVAIRLDCSLVGIDHHNKLAGGQGVTPDAVNDVQGSIGKGGIADAIWGIYKSRTKTEALLQIDGRDIEQVMSLAVKMDHATAAWQIEGDYYEIKQSEGRQAILDALEDEGPMTLTQLSSYLSRKKPNVTYDLKILIAEHKINKDTDKTYHLIIK